jgi:hypothetical protein
MFWPGAASDPVWDIDAPIRIGFCASATATGTIASAKITTPAVNTLPSELIAAGSTAV